jgi:hypothetical protein
MAKETLKALSIGGAEPRSHHFGTRLQSESRLKSSRGAMARVASNIATDLEIAFGVSSTNSKVPSFGNGLLIRVRPSVFTQPAKALTPKPAITAAFSAAS